MNGARGGYPLFIYSLRMLNVKLETLIEHLRYRGVDIGVHFITTHKFGFYKSAKCEDMSVTDKVVKEVMTYLYTLI